MALPALTRATVLKPLTEPKSGVKMVEPPAPALSLGYDDPQRDLGEVELPLTRG